MPSTDPVSSSFTATSAPSTSEVARIFSRSTPLIVVGLIFVMVSVQLSFYEGMRSLDFTELIGLGLLATALFQLAKIDVGQPFRDVMWLLGAGLLFTLLILFLAAVGAARGLVEPARQGAEFFLWTPGILLFSLAMSWLCRAFGLQGTGKLWRKLAVIYGGILILVTVAAVVLSRVVPALSGGEKIRIESLELGCLVVLCIVALSLAFLLTLNRTQRDFKRLAAAERAASDQ